MSYPKKLYFGTLKNRNMKTVQNAETEQQLRSQGWVDFAQLGKGTADDGLQTKSLECEALKQQYAQLQDEHEKLLLSSSTLSNRWDDVVALRMRLNELEQPQSPPSNANYETWTVKQLRDELEKYGITPSQDTRKADLIDLLKQMQEIPVAD